MYPQPKGITNWGFKERTDNLVYGGKKVEPGQKLESHRFRPLKKCWKEGALNIVLLFTRQRNDMFKHLN